MKKLWLTLAVVALMLFVAACSDSDSSSGSEGESSEGDTFEISYSTWASEGEPAYQGMEKFKEIVEEKTNGNVKVELFPGNQLGSTVEQMEQVKMGTIEMMSSGDPGMDEIEYLSLPYLMKSYKHWNAVLESDIGQEWNNQLISEQGVRNIGILPRGPRVISANKAIKEPADMEGLKVRAPATDYYVQTFEALGANPTPMDFGEVYNALQTGLVEGQENPLETIYAAGFHEVQDYVINSNHMFKPAFVTVNDEFFQSLPEDYQQIFIDAAKEGEAYAQEQLDANAADMKAEMEEAGVEFIDPNIEAFKEATQVVRDNLGTEVWGEEVYKQVAEIGQSELD
ncbi:TRAP transporter substrate-binding protein [Salinibacillus xinjiangensis]|uniref:DctP family TRAP transporter solute-binding subunit n=1 Tax=Salinibacillus xinjiangensis TaxID=1229268 RepID=A0A6G1X8J3_9BACI|nr:TRAP transporter substrate-binding protein [Salinibacillus xinjiangensis]MRG87262.1 DctP family TRAP transporter solute-binding subunit [Salinibacillus xinjiangensis]